MDQLAAAIHAACTEAMKDLRDNLHAQNVNHHHAIDLFNNRFGELRRLLKEQAERLQILENKNTTLKEALPLAVVHTSPRHADAVGKELEQLRQTAFANKQSLQNQLGALQAAQKQQLATLQALTNKTTTVPSPNGKLAPAPGLDMLNAQQNQLVAQMRCIENHHGEVTRAINNQAAEIGKLRTVAVAHEKGDGQGDRDELLAGIREAITELQTAQKDQLRMIESYATSQRKPKQSQAQLETLSDALRRNVDDIRRDQGEHATRFVSIDSDITEIISRLESSEVDAGQLREELLTVTRTMLEVIKHLRGSAPVTGIAQEEEGGEDAPISHLQEQVMAAPTVRLVPHSSSPTKDAPLDEDASVQEPSLEDSRTMVADEDVQMSITVAVGSGDKAAASPKSTTDQDDGSMRPPLGPSTKKRSNFPSADGSCDQCSRTGSSMWRRGPDGVRTLCNTCGQKYAKSLQKAKEAMHVEVEPEAIVAVTATVVRESSISSGSTFCTHDQKEARLEDLPDRALKRKATLSPLKERFDGASREMLAPDGLKSAMNSPSVKLTKTGYDLIETSQLTAADEASATSRGHDADDRDDTASSTGAAAKRMRMNADQKARLMADDFVADNGSDDGKKKRRIAARKTVRFDFGADFGRVESDAEGAKNAGDTNPGGKVKVSGTRGSADSIITSATLEIDQGGDKTILESGTVKDMQSGPPRQVRRCGRPPLKGARKAITQKASKSDRAGKSAPEPVTIPKTAGKQSSGLTPNAVPDEHQTSDDPDDCIVVASPGIPVPQNTKPASPPAKRAAELNKGVETLHDMLGSEDELALPTRFHPTNARSTYTAASAPEDTAVRSIEQDTYQSLLSQFNLREGGNRGGQGKQQEMAAADLSANSVDDEADGRPKRAPKPRNFGDVVDVRTLKVKDLGK